MLVSTNMIHITIWNMWFLTGKLMKILDTMIIRRINTTYLLKT